MLFFNPLNPGPTAAPPYQQPGAGNPAPNPGVANFPVGKNPLNIGTLDSFWQPGAASFGRFDISAAPIICPLDGTTTHIVGSHDFPYLCPNCGHQFRADGKIFQPIAFPAQFIVPPNPSIAGSQWPTDALPPVDFANQD